MKTPEQRELVGAHEAWCYMAGATAMWEGHVLPVEVALAEHHAWERLLKAWEGLTPRA